VNAFVGSSVAVGALVSLLFIWAADFIIDFCGFSNLLITAFTFYILRYTGLLQISRRRVRVRTCSIRLVCSKLKSFPHGSSYGTYLLCLKSENHD